MATIKSFTSLEQSKKLAEILPLESADMKILPFTEREYRIVPINDIAVCGKEDEIYAWSLAALLGVLPNPSLHKVYTGWRCDTYNENCTQCQLGNTADTPVDACYEMVLKLHGLKML